jgi:phospholipid/cholesterol/gamma-HCH transport system ATP-binding protein
VPPSDNSPQPDLPGPDNHVADSEEPAIYHATPAHANSGDPPPNGNFFEVHDVHKSLGHQHILKGIDLDVPRGQCTVLIGASGGGKSVFLKHLIGLLQPDQGTVTVDGTDISHMKERQLGPVRRKLGVLFQDGALFDSMNVAQNVAFPLYETGVRDPKELEKRVRKALRVVELEEHLHKMPIELSGGMRKRVGLARAIIGNPECILYDEPTAGLDPIVADSINHLISRLEDDFEVTSVVVTHDMTSVYHVADRVAFLRDGRIYFNGTPEQLRDSTDPAIQDFVLGRSHIGEGRSAKTDPVQSTKQ